LTKKASSKVSSKKASNWGIGGSGLPQGLGDPIGVLDAHGDHAQALV
jgi:hypothetical protein